MPIYVYKNKAGETFEEIRPFSKADEPFYSPSGELCERVKYNACSGWKGDREAWEVDSQYCKALKPKYIKTRSGHRVKYDPTKHC